MKEVTNIMTVQFTAISKLTDEDADLFLSHKKERSVLTPKILKKQLGMDDVLILSDNDFVRDIKEDGEDV